MNADQVGEQPEHPDDAGILQLRRLRVEGAGAFEEASVGKEDRHRDVGLKTIHRRRMMIRVAGILGDVIDHDGLARLVHP